MVVFRVSEGFEDVLGFCGFLRRLRVLIVFRVSEGCLVLIRLDNFFEKCNCKLDWCNYLVT